MDKKTTMAEMLAKKAALEAKLKVLESRKAVARKAKIAEARKSSLSYLIESEMDKAAVVMAAQAIVEKIGKMAEELAKIEGDEVMPMMDSLKTAFGPQMADAFQKGVGEQVRSATTAMTAVKDAISTQVSKLEGVVEGESTNDMASYDAAADEPAPATMPAAEPDLGDDLGADLGTDMAADADLGDEDADMSDLDDLFKDEPEAGAAGRARKESVYPRGRVISESVMSAFKDCFAPHMANVDPSSDPRARLNALKPYVVAEDFEIAVALPDYVLLAIFDKIDDDAASVSTLGAVPAVAPVGAMPAPALPAPAVATMGSDDLGTFGDEMGLGDTMGPEVDEMDLIGANPVFESVSDRTVRATFARLVNEGHAAGTAARSTAAKLGIDFDDVVAIVREAKAAKAAKKDAKAPCADEADCADKKGAKAPKGKKTEGARGK